MTYVSPNYPSKAALKRALADGVRVTAFEPGLGTLPTEGTVTLEGPHYPQPHRWYGRAVIRNGVVVSVK